MSPSAQQSRETESFHIARICFGRALVALVVALILAAVAAVAARTIPTAQVVVWIVWWAVAIGSSGLAERVGPALGIATSWLIAAAAVTAAHFNGIYADGSLRAGAGLDAVASAFDRLAPLDVAHVLVATTPWPIVALVRWRRPDKEPWGSLPWAAGVFFPGTILVALFEGRTGGGTQLFQTVHLMGAAATILLPLAAASTGPAWGSQSVPVPAPPEGLRSTRS